MPLKLGRIKINLPKTRARNRISASMRKTAATKNKAPQQTANPSTPNDTYIPSHAAEAEALKTVKEAAHGITKASENFFNAISNSFKNALNTLTKPFQYVYKQLKKFFKAITGQKSPATPEAPKANTTASA